MSGQRGAPEPATGTVSWAVARYLAAATTGRGADAGASVGLVLIAVSPATGLSNGAAAGGLLAAALTAPHVLGPWVARQLDRAADGRWLLAAAFVAYGVALAAGALALGRVVLPMVVVLVALAGLCGPLLTGGLSSRLAGIVRAGRPPTAADETGDRARTQRRAEGLDAVSYGVAGSAGPAAVAGLAALTTPLVAVLVLSVSAAVGGLLTLTLPKEHQRPSADRDALTVRAALRLLTARGPLRRVTLATMLAAFSTGGMAVIAVVFGSQLSSRPSAGAVLAAAFGLGFLAGSLTVTALPLRGKPERLVARYAVVVAVALGCCALAPTYPVAVAAFVLAGAVNAPFLTATLASRSVYSPPEARAQVFVSIAGLKTATGSAGAALVGVAIGLGPRALLGLAALVTLVAAASVVVDRRTSRSSAATEEDPHVGPEVHAG